MHILRPIEQHDEKQFLQLINGETMYGITSLPRDPHRLQKKLTDSLQAFAKKSDYNGEERYLFVLENSDTQAIEGCCGINARTSTPTSEYYYKIEMEIHPQRSTEWVIPKQKLLVPTAQPANTSRICALLLASSARGAKLGTLLSLSRFLYIGSHRERFESKVMAELRGYIEPNGTCPFWEGVGRQFYDVEFETAMALIERGDQPASEILPRHPIYIAFLPEEIQELLGEIHPATEPALKILQNEGFSITNGIDLFDGGLRVEVDTSNIRSIKNLHTAKIKSVGAYMDEPKNQIVALIATTRNDFRCCRSTIKIEGNEVHVNEQTARALKVEVGEMISYTECLHE